MNPAPNRDSFVVRFFPALFGGFLGLTLLKFGNPPVMEKWVTRPTNGWEFILGFPWPINWAYFLLFFVAVGGVFAAVRLQSAARAVSPAPTAPLSPWTLPSPKWVSLIPVIWLLWQFLAASDSVQPALSRSTVHHFIACVVCFYLGLFVLSKYDHLSPFWTGLLACFVIVLAIGWEQRFGGLEATRKFFYEEIYPTLKEVSPEYLKKLASDRIFSTLFYPNSLAGGILLLLPPTVVFVWGFGGQGRMTPAARSTLTGLFAAAAIPCLYWSGSKGGWLLMLLLGMIILLRLPFRHSLKVALVALVFGLGLAGFTWKFSAYLKKGATSVVARFDYWRAAVVTAGEHPWLGTGPGTFAIPYERIKRPEAEMARLTHNDYLEQASDSGLAGAAFYLAFVCSAVAIIGSRVLRISAKPAEGVTLLKPTKPERAAKGTGPPPKTRKPGQEARDPEESQFIRLQLFALWLGLLAWALHSTFDFGLYVPALAWIAFTFCGFLLAKTGDSVIRTNPNPGKL
jgi:hypothetical protein